MDNNKQEAVTVRKWREKIMSRRKGRME